MDNSFNKQISAYSKPSRPPKQHLLETLEHAGRFLNTEKSLNVLDIGCASGDLLSLLHEKYAQHTYVGIEPAQELVDIARRRLSNDIELIITTEGDFIPSNYYDLIIASGVLSIFEDFEQPLQRWLSWLGDNGTLLIFGRFNSRNIDTIIKFRNKNAEHDTDKWQGGLSSYSISTVSSFLELQGFSSSFKRFYLACDLLEDESNPIRTYTLNVHDSSGETQRYVVNGANIIAEHYFLTISKK